jgi:hypothetical protein
MGISRSVRTDARSALPRFASVLTATISRRKTESEAAGLAVGWTALLKCLTSPSVRLPQSRQLASNTPLIVFL